MMINDSQIFNSFKLLAIKFVETLTFKTTIKRFKLEELKAKMNKRWMLFNCWRG